MVKFAEKLAAQHVHRWEAHYMNYTLLKGALMARGRRNTTLGVGAAGCCLWRLRLRRQPANEAPLLSASPVNVTELAPVGGAGGGDGAVGAPLDEGDEEAPLLAGAHDDVLPGHDGARVAAATALDARLRDALRNGRFRAVFAAELSRAAEFYGGHYATAAARFEALERQVARARGGDWGGDGRAPLRGGGQDYHSIKRALVEVHTQLTNLRSFADVNYLCVVKIMRKYDALEGRSRGGGGGSGGGGDGGGGGGGDGGGGDGGGGGGVAAPAAAAAATERSSSVVYGIAAGLSFGDFTAVDASIEAAEALFAGLFTAGQRGLARVGLLVERRPAFNWTMFDAGVRVGVMLILAAWLGWNVLVDAVQPTPGETARADSVHAAAPVFRGVGCLILVVWLWGAQLWVWTKAHVNYMLLFDSDPRTSLDYRVVLREASSMTIWFLSALLLSYKIARHEVNTFIPGCAPPGLLFLYTLWRAVFPWRERRGLWLTLAQSAIAPFGPMRFRHNYAADFLTSMVRVLSDVSYTVCYFTGGAWVHLDTSETCASMTSGYAYWSTPLVRALPLWFRFCQCFKVYYNTRKRFPALANAAKYSFAQSVVLVGTLQPNFNDTTGGVTPYQGTWMALFVVSSLYSYAWDVRMDWGLGDRAHGWLRRHRLYTRAWVYYAAIVIDFFLRFAWAYALVPPQALPPVVLVNSDLYIYPFLAAAEICRRAMWGCFRAEWEHIARAAGADCDGCEVVPLHVEARAPETAPRTMRTVLCEVAVFAAVVVGITLAAILTSSTPN